MRQQGCARPPGLILRAGRFKTLSAVYAGHKGNMFPNFYMRQIKEQIRRVGLAESCYSLVGKQARAAAKAKARPDQERYYSQWAERLEAMLAELEKGNWRGN